MSKHTISIAPDESVEVEQVGGDLHVQGWDASEVQASGDGVRVERRTGSVVISCSGDLSLSMPRGAHISAATVGGDARLENLSGNVELSVVGGDAVLLNLTGPVQLNGIVGGDTHMENVANISMSPAHAGPGFDFGDRIRRKVERATRRAEEKMQRAEARARTHSHVTFGWDPFRGSSSQPAAEPASDEERMAILRMLQEKKITSEQADQLLAALDGKS